MYREISRNVNFYVFYKKLKIFNRKQNVQFFTIVKSNLFSHLFFINNVRLVPIILFVGSSLGGSIHRQKYKICKIEIYLYIYKIIYLSSRFNQNSIVFDLINKILSDFRIRFDLWSRIDASKVLYEYINTLYTFLHVEEFTYRIDRSSSLTWVGDSILGSRICAFSRRH